MQDLKDLTRLEDDYLLFVIRRASLEEKSTWEKTTLIYNYCTDRKRTSDSLRGRYRAILKDGKIRNVVKNEVKRAWWAKKETEIVALVRREDERPLSDESPSTPATESSILAPIPTRRLSSPLLNLPSETSRPNSEAAAAAGKRSFCTNTLLDARSSIEEDSPSISSFRPNPASGSVVSKAMPSIAVEAHPGGIESPYHYSMVEALDATPANMDKLGIQVPEYSCTASFGTTSKATIRTDVGIDRKIPYDDLLWSNYQKATSGLGFTPMNTPVHIPTSTLGLTTVSTLDLEAQDLLAPSSTNGLDCTTSFFQDSTMAYMLGQETTGMADSTMAYMLGQETTGMADSTMAYMLGQETPGMADSTMAYMLGQETTGMADSTMAYMLGQETTGMNDSSTLGAYHSTTPGKFVQTAAGWCSEDGRHSGFFYPTVNFESAAALDEPAWPYNPLDWDYLGQDNDVD